MSARGPYAKGVAKRLEILDAALRVIAEHGYSGATVKQLADEVGLSQNGLLHHFGSKDALLVEVLRHRDEADSFLLTGTKATPVWGNLPNGLEELRNLMVAAVRHNAAVPGLVHLFAQFTADASEASHPAHNFFADRYETARSFGERAIEALQERGQVRTDVNPRQATVMLFALIDGLQNQWMYKDSIDMGEHIGAFLDTLGPSSDSRT
ncbi:TetR/AcrR family transcriptional regulator [Arthrobacter sp. ISL-65]|uniref:TetR/AcrR family transcriptional regulator n=1 Tax=Arthrobacter sp. ISL-65 TaxID=2819112 RepID=UPI001BE5A849|nr:TetR/AcrR family transcriptional regulator [Arthrobacter sp. ISL-65]MBT2550560.1 TetR/AcrR family transcriptional regulator [Arthrobacter sp. ISL-65]